MQGALNYDASLTCHIFPRERNRYARLIHRILDERTIRDGQHLRPLKNCRASFETKLLLIFLRLKVFGIQLVHNPLCIFASCPRCGVRGRQKCGERGVGI